jgi:hypothetical protein
MGIIRLSGREWPDRNEVRAERLEPLDPRRQGCLGAPPVNILCTTRPKSKSTRKSTRSTQPFAAGLEPTVEPSEPTRCVIIEHPAWDAARHAGDDSACRYEMQVFCGSKLTATEKGFSLARLRSLAKGLGLEPEMQVETLTKSPVPIPAKVSTPRGRFTPSAEDCQWAAETSPYNHLDYDVLVPNHRPIKGGSPLDFPRRVRPIPAMGRQPNVMSDGPGMDSYRGWGGHDETTTAFASEGR